MPQADLDIRIREDVFPSALLSPKGGLKCRLCSICDGLGCVGELPGMGGAGSNENFIRNRADWSNYHRPHDESQTIKLPSIRLAPITGAVQNIGYHAEKPFYYDMISACAAAGCGLSIGDGWPDEKFEFGVEALMATGRQGAVFIKPYGNERICERIDFASQVSEIVGVDIDSYTILTMRNLVHLERKTAADLSGLKKYAKVPFAIKGVFRDEDIELVREVRPDIVVVSNHGGRIETCSGSTAAFLAAHGRELARYAGEVWVDGGLRRKADLEAAARLGASTVLIGRPLVSALLKSGAAGVAERYRVLQG